MKFQFAYKVWRARHDLLILVHTQSNMCKHATLARFLTDVWIYFIIFAPLGKVSFNGLKKYSIFIQRLYMRYV